MPLTGHAECTFHLETTYLVLSLEETVIGYKNSTCTIQSLATRYKYRCFSKSNYVLTIPAQNMTEYEQASVWRCEYIEGHIYRSPDMVLYIASKIFNLCFLEYMT